MQTWKTQFRESRVSKSDGKLTVSGVCWSRALREAGWAPFQPGQQQQWTRSCAGDGRALVLWGVNSFPPSLGVEGGCRGHLANFIPRNANEGGGDGPQGRHTEYLPAVQNTQRHTSKWLQQRMWLVFFSIVLNDSNTERKSVASKMFLFLKHRSLISL